MIKVKNAVLAAMVATFVFAGVEVGQATAHANAQPTTHVVKHAKKTTKKAKKATKKHVKKSTKKNARKVVKKHVKKGELKARVAKKSAVKKAVAKKTVAKKADKAIVYYDKDGHKVTKKDGITTVDYGGGYYAETIDAPSYGDRQGNGVKAVQAYAKVQAAHEPAFKKYLDKYGLKAYSDPNGGEVGF